MKNKAIQERKVLDRFINAYPEFPDGRIFKTESPDFILAMTPKYHIGIELTHLHDPAGKKNTSYSAIQVTKEILDAVILKKEEKIRIYEKKKLNEIWLIITMIEPDQVPGYNLDNKMAIWQFKNGFTRVFLFNLIDDKIFRIG
jgi:hypothetical protein